MKREISVSFVGPTGIKLSGARSDSPTVKSGKRVLISAHGNSLRALVKYIDNIPNEDILGLNIPTGIPLVFELEDDLTAIRNYYIGDPDTIKSAG